MVQESYHTKTYLKSEINLLLIVNDHASYDNNIKKKYSNISLVKQLHDLKIC